MNTHKLPLVAVLTALSLAPLGIAAAEDFTIPVPVSVSNMRAEVTGIRVWCGVGVPPVQSVGDLVGSSETSAGTPDASGNLTAKVVVKFNAREGRSPTDATHYRCDLRVVASNISDFGACTSGGGYPWVQAKAGTTCTLLVQGPLPQ